MNANEWVERMGGYAVVLLITKWMMSRMDKLIDNLTRTAGAFSEFKEEFHDYRRADTLVHQEIVDELRKLRAGEKK